MGTDSSEVLPEHLNKTIKGWRLPSFFFCTNFVLYTSRDLVCLRCRLHAVAWLWKQQKKAELWAAETHESLYLYSLPRLDFTSLVELQARTLEDGMPRIRPHSQHMCTYLSAVVLCDQADPDALAQLQKLKKHRDFKLSLHGWMEFRIAAVDLSTGDIATNRSGKDLGKSLSGLVAREIQKFKLRRGET